MHCINKHVWNIPKWGKCYFEYSYLITTAHFWSKQCGLSEWGQSQRLRIWGERLAVFIQTLVHITSHTLFSWFCLQQTPLSFAWSPLYLSRCVSFTQASHIYIISRRRTDFHRIKKAWNGLYAISVSVHRQEIYAFNRQVWKILASLLRMSHSVHSDGRLFRQIVWEARSPVGNSCSWVFCLCMDASDDINWCYAFCIGEH